MDDLTGQTIGSYRLVEKLGAGGMAEVYKSYQPRLDRYVAIKFIRPELAVDTGFRTRFEQEARAIARLSHSNIVHIYDFGEEDRRYFLVMEFIEGQTLKSYLQEQFNSGRQVPLTLAISIISQVAAALDYAHSHSIIHRDVKPDNILLSGKGRAVLNDFGIARITDLGEGMTQTGMAMGTPAYMSPEQIQGNKEQLGPPTDIYSLGIITYELLTGHTPFTADTPFAVMLKHLNDPIPLPRQLNPVLPEALERVLLKVLAKDPADRYQTAGAFVQALQQAVEGVSDEALQVVSAPPAEDKTRLDPSRIQKTVVDPAAGTVAHPAESTIPAAGTPPHLEQPQPEPAPTPTRRFYQRVPRWAWVGLVIFACLIVAGILRNIQENNQAALLPDYVVYTSQNQLFRMLVDGENEPENITALLDQVSTGEDSWVVASNNGRWLLLNTTRSNPDCGGWACLAVVPVTANNGVEAAELEIVLTESWQVLHPEYADINNAGNLIVYTDSFGPNELDIWMIEREEDEENWGAPQLLTEESEFEMNQWPILNQNGTEILFACTDIDEDGEALLPSSLCRVDLDGEEYELLLIPEDGPLREDASLGLFYSDFIADGIIFTAEWEISSIWQWKDDQDEPQPFQANPIFWGDQLACVFQNGTIVTLAWSEEWQGAQIRLTSADGQTSRFLDTKAAVNYGQMGCGG